MFLLLPPSVGGSQGVIAFVLDVVGDMLDEEPKDEPEASKPKPRGRVKL